MLQISFPAYFHPAIHLASTWAYPRRTPRGPQVGFTIDEKQENIQNV